MRTALSISGAVALILVFSGCTTTNISAVNKSDKTAEASLKNASGEDIGTATFTENRNGLDVQLEASKLPSGTLAFHIHENGLCEPPKFESAGEHFNPTHAMHGSEASGGPHLGDLRNITVAEDGKANVRQSANGVSIDGANSIVGKALVIHRNGDDYRTQPSGGSGDRIACGVIQRK
jgi:Cu-Zn family superoxide dismutase